MLPILADFEGISGVIFFIIAFVGWIMNLSKENEKAQQQKQRPRRQRPQGGHNEIDQFLQENKRRDRRAPRDRRPAEVEQVLTEDDIVIVEEAPRRRPPKQRARRERKRVTQSQPNPPRPQPAALPSISVADHVTQMLPHAVDAGVAAHMGVSTGQVGMASTTRDRKAPAAAVITLMRSKRRIRDAIILNEVLSKPKALRK